MGPGLIQSRAEASTITGIGEFCHCSLTNSFQSSPKAGQARPGPIINPVQFSGMLLTGAPGEKGEKGWTMAACDWLAIGT